MRLFAAVAIDEAARAAIAAEQRRVMAAFERPDDLRWTDPAHMHLTLVFAGEVPGPVAEAVITGMAAPFDLAAFRVSFHGVGVFPPRGAPRVLWLGASDSHGALAVLHEAVSRRIDACGVALERRPFHAHLTLARWRDGCRGGRWPGGCDAREVAALDVTEVTLFESRLSPKGSTYIVRARAALGPAAPLQ